MNDKFRVSMFVLLLLVGFGYANGAASAQDGENSSSSAEQASDGDHDFQKLKTEYAAIQAELKAKAATFRATEDAVAQEELKAAYMKLIDQANRKIIDLKHAAEKAFAADSKDVEAAKTMVGIMMNDAQNGRDAEVLRMGDVLIAGGVDSNYFQKAADASRLNIDSKEIFEELVIRQNESAANDLPRVRFSLDAGDVVVELFENEAPNTVANFISLVEKKFYDGLTFHRVMENFMAQGGCPLGNGKGDAGYKIPCECYSVDARKHFTGSLSMAKGQTRDSGCSQFFLTFRRTNMLDGRHTVFGRIVEGMEVLSKITRTYDPVTDQPFVGVEADKINRVSIVRKRDHEYVPKKVGDPEDPVPSPPAQPGGGGDQ